ncbi:sulfatase-like hydrolase/transferase [Halegenticoccus soli]|uniref:sulfatase-like hydrolase/transferase n=1 Tax=Halegenticoccus soli TaxID=1985678 RepID=UPI000C6E4443|nr:sulfatase-like hydrolase/transferase [Halegenticoccus soli]
MTGDRNVVLVCLDAVRKDYFDEYAPRLRAMADVSYEQCRAASGWSVPSHASVMTGELPSEHGIHVYNRDFSGLTRADTFLGDLPDHRATGVSANAYASSAFGFDRMFDDYSDVSPQCRFPEGINVIRFGQESEKRGVARYVDFLRAAATHEHPLASLANGALVQVDRALARLPVPKPLDDGANIVSRHAVRAAREGPEPFFVFTNFMDVHAPLTNVLGYDDDLHDASNTWSSAAFDTDEVNYGGKLEEHLAEIETHRGLYAAAVDYLDRKVAAAIERIEEATDRETTFVITADHGEHLGFPADDGLFGHRGPLTEGLLHVPLEVINAPDGESFVETGYVSHLDLGDLVVGLANGAVPDVARRRIAAERVGSNVPGGADLTAEQREYWDRMVRCVYDGDRKVSWNSAGDRTEYELDPERPCWQRAVRDGVAVAAYEREFFDAPIDEAKRAAREARREVEVDAATADRLRELGYR